MLKILNCIIWHVYCTVYLQNQEWWQFSIGLDYKSVQNGIIKMQKNKGELK